MENAQKFIELRDRINPNTKIWMRMIKGEKNANEWAEYKDFWEPKLAETDRLYYHSMHNWGGQLDVGQVASTYEPNLPCVALWSLMVIFSNGDVPLCNVDYNNKFPTGNVRDFTIAEIWQNKIMSTRRNLHLNGDKKDISLCEKCNVWDEQSNESKDLISDSYAEAIEIAS
jgi:radical SAM protein with 4Fe4S-binding SPASM domain